MTEKVIYIKVVVRQGRKLSSSAQEQKIPASCRSEKDANFKLARVIRSKTLLNRDSTSIITTKIENTQNTQVKQRCYIHFNKESHIHYTVY